MSNQQAYQISAWKAISIVGGAILVSVVGTAFAVGTTLNSDHFLTISNTDRISAIEETAVRQDVLTEQLEPIKDDVREIKLDVKQLIKDR